MACARTLSVFLVFLGCFLLFGSTLAVAQGKEAPGKSSSSGSSTPSLDEDAPSPGKPAKSTPKLPGAKSPGSLSGPSLTGIEFEGCLKPGSVFVARGTHLKGKTLQCRTTCPSAVVSPLRGKTQPTCRVSGTPKASQSCRVSMGLGAIWRHQDVKTCSSSESVGKKRAGKGLAAESSKDSAATFALPSSMKSALSKKRSGPTGRIIPMRVDTEIDIIEPSAGALFHPGGSMTIRYRQVRDAAAGEAKIWLLKQGGTAPIAEGIDAYRPSFGEGSEGGSSSDGLLYQEFSWVLPSGLEDGDDYFIGVQIENLFWGTTDYFSIGGFGEGSSWERVGLTLLQPSGAEHWSIPSVQEIRWQQDGRFGVAAVLVNEAGREWELDWSGPKTHSSEAIWRNVSVPADLPVGHRYRLRLQHMENPRISDESAPFSVGEESVNFSVSIFQEGDRVKALFITPDAGFSGVVEFGFGRGAPSSVVSRHVSGPRAEVVLERVEPGLGYSCGFPDYQVVVDPSNLYAETNESDNAASGEVYYQADHAELQISDGRSTDLGHGSTIESTVFGVHVKNCGWNPISRQRIQIRQNGERPRGGGVLGSESYNDLLKEHRVDIPIGETGYYDSAVAQEDVTYRDSDFTIQFSSNLADLFRLSENPIVLHYDHDEGPSF